VEASVFCATRSANWRAASSSEVSIFSFHRRLAAAMVSFEQSAPSDSAVEAFGGNTIAKVLCGLFQLSEACLRLGGTLIHQLLPALEFAGYSFFRASPSLLDRGPHLACIRRHVTAQALQLFDGNLQLAFNFLVEIGPALLSTSTSWESICIRASARRRSRSATIRRASRPRPRPVRFHPLDTFALHSLHMSGNGGFDGFFGGVLQLGLQGGEQRAGFPPQRRDWRSRAPVLCTCWFCFHHQPRYLTRHLHRRVSAGRAWQNANIVFRRLWQWRCGLRSEAHTEGDWAGSALSAGDGMARVTPASGKGNQSPGGNAMPQTLPDTSNSTPI